jgi:YydF family exported signaling peptide
MSKLMDLFKTSTAFVELDDLDDLWFFVKSTSGAWIVGSGS